MNSRISNRPVWPSVMVTGHRDMTADQARYATSELDRLADKLAAAGTVEAVCGMALGADLAWGEAAVRAGLDVAAYIPCEQQTEKWPAAERMRWRRLRTLAAREVVVGDAPTARVFHARNDAMLAASDAVIVVADPARSGGGTVATWRKASGAGKSVILVDLGRFRTTISR